MGEGNAANALRVALADQKPALVLTCGFAGGLKPELREGQVIFSTEEAELQKALSAEGAQPARFYCANRVAATAEEKRSLRQVTGADAVEMESAVICGFCKGHGVPSAIVRVVLDEAQQDLPLDFNRVMTGKQEMDYTMLALALVRKPGLIPALLRFQKQARSAAEVLADCLTRVIARL